MLPFIERKPFYINNFQKILQTKDFLVSLPLSPEVLSLEIYPFISSLRVFNSSFKNLFNNSTNLVFFGNNKLFFGQDLTLFLKFLNFVINKNLLINFIKINNFILFENSYVSLVKKVKNPIQSYYLNFGFIYFLRLQQTLSFFKSFYF